MKITWYTKEYNRLFTGDPWYGDNIIDSLLRIPAESWHQPVGHQTIARLMGHMLAWRRFIVEKLRNNDDFTITYRSPEEWPAVGHLSAANLLKQLRANQSELLTELTRIEEAELEETIPVTHKYTKNDILNGVLQHDIYHLGQINILARLLDVDLPKPATASNRSSDQGEQA